MAKKKPLLDNLKYIFCKDATNGKQAGFDVQLMRDRLTEIRYDIDHMQSDLDDLIHGSNQIKLDNQEIKARLDLVEQKLEQILGSNNHGKKE